MNQMTCEECTTPIPNPSKGEWVCTMCGLVHAPELDARPTRVDFEQVRAPKFDRFIPRTRAQREIVRRLRTVNSWKLKSTFSTHLMRACQRYLILSNDEIGVFVRMGEGIHAKARKHTTRRSPIVIAMFLAWRYKKRTGRDVMRYPLKEILSEVRRPREYTRALNRMKLEANIH